MTVLYWLTGGAMAHVPNIASFALTEHALNWELDVALSTQGMHQALQQRHPDERLSELSVDAYEARLVDALREGIEITFDGRPATLGEAVVSLAPHETHVWFPVSAPPAGARAVEAHITTFRERQGQFNVFRLSTFMLRDRVVLSEENRFQGTISLRRANVPTRRHLSGATQ